MFSILHFVPFFLYLINIESIHGEFKNNDCINPDEIPGNCMHYRNCDYIYKKLEQPLINNKTRSANNTLTVLRNSYCGTKTNFCCATFPTVEDCKVDLENRIIGGNISNVDEYPWAALLIYRHDKGHINYKCGAALINKNYVLTAAHCVHKDSIGRKKLIGVRLGEWDVREKIDCYKQVCNVEVTDVGIDEEIIHHKYKPSEKFNDIALLRLNTTIEYSKFIKPICLPWAEYLKQDHYKHDLYLSGWGVTSNSKTAKTSDVKMQILLKDFDFDDCINVYGKQISIERTQLCAGGERGKDSCSYDSGSPLVTINFKAEYFYLVGIVSFGPQPCGSAGYPGIYTRVQSYLEWIEENVEPDI